MYENTSGTRRREPHANTLANNLANSLRQRIIERNLKAGDPFMTEAVISREYKVSRPVAREATHQLRALGILRSRQAKGLIVDRSDPVHLFARTLPFVGRTASEFERLAELRYALELGAIDIIVSNASSEQMDKLEELARLYEQSYVKSGNLSEVEEIDREFHCQMLRMSGNPLIAGMHRVLGQYFREYAKHRDPIPIPGRSIIREHHMIAYGIRRGDVEIARAVLRRHMQPILDAARHAVEHSNGEASPSPKQAKSDHDAPRGS